VLKARGSVRFKSQDVFAALNLSVAALPPPPPVPPTSKPVYRSLGIILLVLSLICLGASIDFQFAYPTHSCVSYDFFGNCTQMGQRTPGPGTEMH